MEVCSIQIQLIYKCLLIFYFLHFVGVTSHGNIIAPGQYNNIQQMHGHNLSTADSFMLNQQNIYQPSMNNSANGNVASQLQNQIPSNLNSGQHHPNPNPIQNHIPQQMNLMSGHNDSSHLIPSGSNQFNPAVHRSVQNIPYGNQAMMTQMPPQTSGMNIPSVSQSAPLGYIPSNHQPTMYTNQMLPPTATMPLNHAMNSQSQNQNSFTNRSHPRREWHSTEHEPERGGISEEIVALLKSRRPNAAENWTDKLPHMAKKLEDALYHEASSFEEYKDRSTLKSRLQKLAIQMGNVRQPSNSKNIQPQNMVNSSGSNGSTAISGPLRSQLVIPQPSQPLAPMNKGYQPNGPYQQQPPQQLVPQQVAIRLQQTNMQSQPYLTQQPMMNVPVTQQTNIPPNMYQHQNFPQGLDYSHSIPHSVSISGHSHQPNQYPISSVDINQPNDMNRLYQQTPSHLSGNVMLSNQMSQNTFQPINEAPNMVHAQRIQTMMGQQHNNNSTQVHNPNTGITQSMPQSSMIQSTQNSGLANQHPVNSDEHRKQVLKQQQQRLLLLRHASKCPHDNGRCPVTPHCWGMKQLWKHIMSCKDQDCRIPHCVSSRYVLSHYSKCKEPQCPVCGPVRDAIKKNYERSKEVVGIVGPSAVGNVQASSIAGVNGRNGHPAPIREESDRKRRKTEKSSSQVLQGSLNSNTTLVLRPIQPQIMQPAPPRGVYPLDPISSAVYSFSMEQIESHIKSIHEGLRVKVSKIKEICKPLIEELFRLPHVADIFGAPVDHVALCLPDYPEKIKRPMDLGTVIKKLEAGSYRDFDQMASDVRLTFDNAILYNPPGTEVNRIAKNAKKEFFDKFAKRVTDFYKKLDEDRGNPDACTICGEVRLEFAPPVLYCSGPCAKAIRRNNWYYANNSNTYYWCTSCFTNLKLNEPIQLPDCQVTKSELERNKKQHNEENEEMWVGCDGGCGRWVHQICALFNSRRNVQELPFVCPFCLKTKRQQEPENKNIVKPCTKPTKAIDLPRTVLSDFLESRIQKRLRLAYDETAAAMNVTVNEVEKCPQLTLRQVSCIDKEQDVREGFLQRYKDKEYPTSFPCRVKCLVLFQNVDGQDVILFGMYVYEYGHSCPLPNQRRVYISYLDSVHYLRPKQYRTLVYHEILISYLDYVKARGFHTAHIWSCPPQKGDDYILHIHPADQKTPRPQTLRVWYDEMLRRAMERGIVLEMTDLHSEYLTEANNDAAILPYFEGDYWVNEAEVIIKNLNDGKKIGGTSNLISTSDAIQQQAKRKSKNKKAERQLTKEAGASVSRQERDPLLSKLSTIIEPMKDTFFVARLHPREFAERCAIQLKMEKGVATVAAENIVAEESNLQTEALSAENAVPAISIVDTSTKEETPACEDSDDFTQAAALVDANSNQTKSVDGRFSIPVVVVDGVENIYSNPPAIVDGQQNSPLMQPLENGNSFLESKESEHMVSRIDRFRFSIYYDRFFVGRRHPNSKTIQI
jgi:hypothetical protein